MIPAQYAPDSDGQEHLLDAAVLDKHDHAAQEELAREVDDFEPPVRLRVCTGTQVCCQSIW